MATVRTNLLPPELQIATYVRISETLSEARWVAGTGDIVLIEET